MRMAMTTTEPPFRTGVPTRTLLVNPAFLQEIKDSNPDLWQAIHELRQSCESQGDPERTARRLVRQLDELRVLVSLQFALEESYGFVEVGPSAARSPFFEMAERIHAQHYSLFLRLSDLAEQAEEYQYRGVAAERLPELIMKSRAFDSALRDHERLENDLIELAYEGSIGGGKFSSESRRSK